MREVDMVHRRTRTWIITGLLVLILSLLGACSTVKDKTVNKTSEDVDANNAESQQVDTEHNDTEFYSITLNAEDRRVSGLISVRYDSEQAEPLIAEGEGIEITHDESSVSAKIGDSFKGEIVLGRKINTLTCMGGFHFNLELPAVDNFNSTLLGACDGRIKIDASSMKIAIAGGSKLDFAGSTESLELQVQGGTIVNAEELTANSVVATLQGAGELTVYATDKLEATLEGFGRIAYAGNPGEVEKNVEGLGIIEAIE